MTRPEEEHNGLHRVFQTSQNRKDMDNNEGSLAILDYQPYAVAHSNELVKRFYIHMRSGERYSIPYSLLPIFILKDNQELIIKAYEVQITISGRGLSAIEDALSKEVLTYIKTHPCGKDDGDSSVFIENITLEGENLMH
ncbi:hypothetical protein [Roseivirga pacifica]|nr:hypothetical protein [Roseivirga pacifica]